MPSHQASPSKKALTEEVQQAHVILTHSQVPRWFKHLSGEISPSHINIMGGAVHAAEEPHNISALQEVLEDIEDWNL